MAKEHRSRDKHKKLSIPDLQKDSEGEIRRRKDTRNSRQRRKEERAVGRAISRGTT